MDGAAKEADVDERQDLSEGLSRTVLGSRSTSQDGEAATTLAFSTVFDISPTMALELFCMNIEKLRKSADEIQEKSSTSDASGSSRDTPSDGNRQDDKPAQVSELHCHHSDHARGRDQHERIQQSVLARRFVSKREPPFPLKEYLLRLHQYCPMSTAVYLAASIYITRMTAIDGLITLVPKNVHRLVLSGLRVAMKALEDRCNTHRRFAKVVGVRQRELTRLEISFCFLADFELRVDAEMLLDEARFILNGTSLDQDSPADNAESQMN